MLLNKKEKEELVIKLAEEGKTSRQIAKEAKISLKTIGQILKEYRGDVNDIGNNKNPSTNSIALNLFKKGYSPLDIAIELNLDVDETTNIFRNYLHLSNLNELTRMYEELNKDLPMLISLYKSLKNKGLASTEFINYFMNNYKLYEELTGETKELSDYLSRLYERKLSLEKEYRVLNNYNLKHSTFEYLKL